MLPIPSDLAGLERVKITKSLKVSTLSLLARELSFKKSALTLNQ